MVYVIGKALLDAFLLAKLIQGRARAGKRAREAEREQKEFREKLMRAAASQAELESMSKKIKGTDAAMQRDQLIGLMGGF